MSAGRPLDVDADLTLTVEGAEIDVVGYGDLVVVDAASFAALRALRRDATPAVGVVPDVGVTVDVRVRGVSVARLGPGVPSGLFSRLVGVDGRISGGGVLLAALRAVTTR